MNQHQKRIILEAVKLAQQPGACRYVDDNGQPLCVVAQVAHLEGLNVAELVKGTYKDGIISGVVHSFNSCPILSQCVTPPLQSALREKGYDIFALHQIQKIWDRVDTRYIDYQPREAMQYEVNSWQFTG